MDDLSFLTYIYEIIYIYVLLQYILHVDLDMNVMLKNYFEFIGNEFDFEKLYIIPSFEK